MATPEILLTECATEVPAESASGRDDLDPQLAHFIAHVLVPLLVARLNASFVQQPVARDGGAETPEVVH
jgi:hypothetical protein